MRVIVTLATARWRQWPDHVRQRAIDLYPSHEDVEFWDAGNREGEGDYDLWGAWPRFCDLGPEALVADMLDEALAMGDRPIAFLLLLDAPTDLRAVRDGANREEPSLHGEQLATLRDGLQGESRRILRLGIFRSGAAVPAERQAACWLIGEKLLDGVVFIDAVGEGRDERQFDAVRLLIDAARTGSDNPAFDWLRATLVSGELSGGLHRLYPPDRNAVTLPGAGQAGLMSGFVRSLTEAEGIGRGGEALTPLDLLEAEVERAIETAEARIDLASAKAEEDKAAIGILIEAAGTPRERTKPAVERWWNDLGGHITAKYARRPEDIAVLQMGANPVYIRGLDGLLRQASDIAGGASGLTENARHHCENILQRIEECRRNWGDRARQERRMTDELLTRDAGLVGSDGRFQLSRLPAYRNIEDSQVRSLRHLAANMPSRWVTGGVVGGLLVGFYVLLAVQTHGRSPDGDWIGAAILGPAPARIIVLAGFALCCLGLRYSLHRRTDYRWQEVVGRIRTGAAGILLQAHEVVRHTMHYRGCTEVAAGLAPVQARMSEIVDDMKDGKQRLDGAARLLRASGTTPTPDEQEKFNDRQGQLKGAPVREWVRRMLAAAKYPDPDLLILAFGTNRTGEGTVHVRSRLRVSGDVRVDAIVP